MRISDWSSDVCSSDLLDVGGIGDQPIARHQGRQTGKDRQHRVKSDTGRNDGKIVLRNLVLYAQQDIAPPACRDLSRPGGNSPAPVLLFRLWIAHPATPRLSRFLLPPRRHPCPLFRWSRRSEERRGGQECVSSVRSRWAPEH